MSNTTRLEVEIRERIKLLRGELRLLEDVLAAGTNGRPADEERFPVLPEDRDEPEPAEVPDLDELPEPKDGPVVMVPKSRHRKRQAPAPVAGKLGSREGAILDVLRKRGGLRIPELAREMGLPTDKYLYRALPRLQARGLVRTENGAELGHNPVWRLAK